MTDNASPTDDSQALTDYLNALHVEAGLPSMRQLATEVGVSHSTVHSTIIGRTIPGRPTLRRLITVLSGDVARAEELCARAEELRVRAGASRPVWLGRVSTDERFDQLDRRLDELALILVEIRDAIERLGGAR